jgi:hypothetical protein
MPTLFTKSSTEKQKRAKLLGVARRSVKNIFNSQIIPMEMIYSQKQPKHEKIVEAEKLTQPHSPMQIEEPSRRSSLSRRLKDKKGGKRKSRKARRSMKSRK